MNPPSADSEVLLQANDVGKVFCKHFRASLWYGLLDGCREFFPGSERSFTEESDRLRAGEFWANKNITFELKRGECLGLIGHNGAGKTTLLKLLNGLIKPDVGRIATRGRVGAMIALGAGFNPILSGRENIYINASILGLSKGEIDERIDEIIDFSGIRSFIDAPVRNYSSGMQVRLGFSIASSVKPDVLLIDEVLAVGDIEFRSKCYERIGELLRSSAVILVSHNMNHVSSICNSALYLEKGQSEGIAPVDQAVSEYLKRIPTSQGEGSFVKTSPLVPSGEVLSIPSSLQYHDDFQLSLRLIATENVVRPSIRVIFYNAESVPVMDWWSRRGELIDCLEKGENIVEITSGPVLLKTGTYRLGIVLLDHTGCDPIFWSYLEETVEVVGADCGSPVQLPEGECRLSSGVKGEVCSRQL